MHRYQTLLQPSLQTGTMVQKVDVSALATRRNRSFYLFEGMGINSHEGSQGRRPDGRTNQPAPIPRVGILLPGRGSGGNWKMVQRDPRPSVTIPVTPEELARRYLDGATTVPAWMISAFCAAAQPPASGASWSLMASRSGPGDTITARADRPSSCAAETGRVRCCAELTVRSAGATTAAPVQPEGAPDQ